MKPDELTQWLNLAKALDIIVSSRTINGMMYVYTQSGGAKPWNSIAADYPLERLQAMANRRISIS